MVKAQPNWDRYYSTLKRVPRRLKINAHFISTAVPALKKHKVKRVLDLGCGAGRHCILLAGSGFEVVGIDISKSALKLARRWVQKEGPRNVAFVRATMTNVPLNDHCPDAVVSVSVMHHALKEDIIASVGKVHRILGKHGWFIANLASAHDPRHGTGRMLEKDTFWIPEAYEKKQFRELHHFFTKHEAFKLLTLFSKVEVTSMEDKPNYWKIVAVK